MTKRILLQLSGVVQTLILASLISFVILRLLPGDPARLIAGPLASEGALATINSQLGLDQPIWVQYITYLGNFVTGDWGFSFSNGADVSAVIVSRLPATLELALFAFVFALAGALIVATLASYRKGVFAGIAKGASLIGLGTPPFWLALILILIFSVGLKALPGPSGRISSFLSPPPQITGLYTLDSLLTGNVVAFSDALAHIILPAIALSILPWAFLTRLLTANQTDIVPAPFVTVVRSKGVSRWRTHRRHVVHNALLPAISSSGMILATLITSSVLIEQTFDWPGIGQVLVQGIQRQDFAVVQVFILLSAFIYVGANLVADLVLEFADPRLRVRGGTS
jgi:peptide/nickel transport system permease protein